MKERGEEQDRTVSTVSTAGENAAVGVEAEPTVAVSRKDLEEDAKRRVLESAGIVEAAEVVVVEDGKDGKGGDVPRSRRILWPLPFLAFLATLAVAASVGAVVASSGRRDGDDGSSSLRGGATDAPTSSPPSPQRQPGLVYVASTANVNWCGHNDHRAARCGGRLASASSAEELRIVKDLAAMAVTRSTRELNHTSWGGAEIEWAWIGGRQDRQSRSPDRTPSSSENSTANPCVWSVDSGGEHGGTNCSRAEEEFHAVWVWDDGTYWDESLLGGEWLPGQPDNAVDTLARFPGDDFRGQHELLLGTTDGKFRDANGCHGWLAPKGPGVYLLPDDYEDRSRYPDCQVGSLLADEAVPVPGPRPTADLDVYAVSIAVDVDRCGHERIASACGGRLAEADFFSREWALVREVLDEATIEVADRYPNNETETETEAAAAAHSSAWIGCPATLTAAGEGCWSYADDYSATLVVDKKCRPCDVPSCQGGLGSPPRPAILSLPADYRDASKYPDCAVDDVIHESARTASRRPAASPVKMVQVPPPPP